MIVGGFIVLVLMLDDKDNDLLLFFGKKKSKKGKKKFGELEMDCDICDIEFVNDFLNELLSMFGGWDSDLWDFELD